MSANPPLPGHRRRSFDAARRVEDRRMEGREQHEGQERRGDTRREGRQREGVEDCCEDGGWADDEDGLRSYNQRSRVLVLPL